MRRLLRSVLLTTCCCLFSTALNAAIFPSNTGDWPKEWGQELEPFRKTSKTLGVGTGIQENIYTIPFEKREDFEKVWPVILKQTTPNSEVRLRLVSKKAHLRWGKFLKGAKPCVHILGPSLGWSIDPAHDYDPAKGLKDQEKLIKEGKMIQANAPWPAYLKADDGGLPEYVVSQKGEDGRLRWVPSEIGDELKGFHNRARVDIELVIDGEIIDLNRIRFPEHVRIIDKRESLTKPDTSDSATGLESSLPKPSYAPTAVRSRNCRLSYPCSILNTIDAAPASACCV